MIRWKFTDRRTGKTLTVDHPTNDEDRATLKQVLHNLL